MAILAISGDRAKFETFACDRETRELNGGIRMAFRMITLGVSASLLPASRLALAASLSLATVVLQDSARAEDVPGVTSDEIRIGSFGAFDGQGYLFGRLTMNGIDAVFHKVNAEGGINGRRLVLIREDDRCDPGIAVAAVRALVSVHKTFALLGGGCSNATLAARSEIEKAQIPFNDVASVVDAISHPVSKYIYTTQLTASLESEAQLEYAINHGAKKIAIVAQHDAWGRAGYDPLVADFKKRNLSPVIDLTIGPEEQDASQQALQIAQVEADAVVLVLYPKPGTAITRDLAKLGYKPMLIGQTAIDPLALAAAIGVSGGADRYVTPTTVRYLPSDPEMKGWTSLLEEMYPNEVPSTFNLMGIGAAQVMVAALKAAGPNLTRERYLAAMAHIEVETDTLSSTIVCDDPTSHQCNRTPAWIGIVNGRPEIIDPRD
jgi:branched-chain amino acid transport system substrate-binding protein